MLTAQCTPARAAAARSRVCTVTRAEKFVRVPSNYRVKDKRDNDVDGNDWYSKTRRAALDDAARRETDSKYDEMYAERRRKVKRYVDREDLYTDQWDGDVYKGSRWNVLTVLAAIFILTPVAGLIFAYFSYGTVWG